MPKVKFGTMIREARQKKGMTQFELATALGYETPQFISLIERDQSKPPLQMLGQLIVILGMNESEIVGVLMKAYKEELSTDIERGKKEARKNGT